MKKFTIMLLVAFVAIASYAAGPKKQFSPLPFTPAKAGMQMGQQFNAKPAPKGLAMKAVKNGVAKIHAPKKAMAAADLAGDYQWDYLTASDLSTDIEALDKTAGSTHVVITVAEGNGNANAGNSWVAAEQGYGNAEDVSEIAIDDYTKGTLAAGTNETNSPKYYDTGSSLRMYTGNTLTITSEKAIAKIEITFSGNATQKLLTADKGEYALEESVGTWTGEAQEVVFTVPTKEEAGISGNPQARIQEIKIVYVAGEEETEEPVAAGDAITISGMFSNDLTATVINDEEGTYFVIEAGQIAGTSSYGDYALYGVFYDEGDDENEAGWYYTNIYGYVLEDGSIAIYPWLSRVLSGGQYDGYSLAPYWVEGSTLTPAEPLTVVTPPAGVAILPYVMNYDEGNKAVNVAVDGNDVYFQGLSDFLPESWVKGKKDGNTVTFPAMQWVGTYGSYGDSYAFYNGDAVFTYDAEADTYSAEGVIYGVLADSYYDGKYTNPVLKPVVEKAAMPANPTITDLKNGNYGWYFTFNVPLQDTEGEPLMASKLAYMIYTDVEGEITPLTFTPATHVKLTENLTEIPYGFTENYDFYDTQIYLNDLYSADWNKLGIQSIYRGGGEENITEIQWFEIKPYTVIVSDNIEWIAGEQGYSNAESVTEIKFSETITGTLNKAEGTNEPKYYDSGEALRMYAGNTLTITSESPIGKIEFTLTGSTAQMKLEADKGEYEFAEGVGTWTGEETEIVFSVPNESGNQARIQKIVIYTAGGSEPVVPDGTLFTFDDGTLQGWTTIDADGDGYDWTPVTGESLSTHGDSEGSVFSQSYDNSAGALTPDNFLVSPQMKLDGSISFWACAQDASYPAEHFGVFVSTKGNTDAADFEAVQEWTMTASRVDNPANARGTFRSPKKTPGTWYLYTVDLSSYEGAEGYVAIRHFDCTDNFYLVVDDITLQTSEFIFPDYTITPAEGKVKSLGEFEITFNNYTVAIVEGEAAQAELYKDENFDEPFATASLALADGKVLSFSFDNIEEAGEYTLLIPDGTLKNVDAETILGDLEFHYSIPEPPVAVVLPEGVEAETWYLNCSGYSGTIKNQAVAVAIDGNDIYVQGLNSTYLPEAWVKGTIEGNTATFPTGQYFGAFESEGEEYDMFFVGLDYEADALCDVVFNYDAEAGSLTTEHYIIVSPDEEFSSLYDYLKEISITREPAEFAEPITELPEGVEAEDWYLSALDNYGDVDVEVEVAIDGTDMYIKGLDLENTDEPCWVKGTIADGKVTFPSGQLFGQYEDWWYGNVYDVFFMGYDEETGDFSENVVFDYDAEAGRLTTDNWILVNGSTTELDLFTYYNMIEITKDAPVLPEPVVAPENLELTEYAFTANELAEEEDEETGETSTVEEDVNFDVVVGFDGNDVYFKGFTGSLSDEVWAKGTLGEDGKTITIPANQYMGVVESIWSDDYYYITAANIDGDLQDIVLTIDAENGKITTDQLVYLNASRKTLYYYNEWYNVVMTKKLDVAATPADPEVLSISATGSYPKAKFSIPTEDVDGNPLISSKLFYTVWVEKEDNVVEQFVVTADAYESVEEDMVEIPYSFNDDWDIYEGGATFYINPAEVAPTFVKIGVQSIYYGGGECNKSNIAWMENADYNPATGIASVATDSKDTVYFDLQGRRVAAPTKGLYIMNNKKVVIK